jgi:hypothetical protein
MEVKPLKNMKANLTKNYGGKASKKTGGKSSIKTMEDYEKK